MNLLHKFLTHQLPGAQKDEVISKSIATYSWEDKIFIIASGTKNGLLTEEVKEDLLMRLKSLKKTVYYFLLFKDKDEFQEFCDKISWGNYAWIATNPEHIIHFDIQPELSPKS